MAKMMPGPLPPTIAGLTPEPKTIKKKKTWTEELNDLGRFVLGPHGDALFQAGELAAQFTPGAEIQDVLESSGQLSKGVQNLNPWEAGMGMAGLIAAWVPGPSKIDEMPFIHGSQHKFEPEGNHPLGKFREDKLLSGEGTNYEGMGTYLTDPVAGDVANYYADMGPMMAKSKVGDVDLLAESDRLRKEINDIYKKTTYGEITPETELLQEKRNILEQINNKLDDYSVNFRKGSNVDETLEVPDYEVNRILDEAIKDNTSEMLFMEDDDTVEAIKSLTSEDLLSFVNQFKDKSAIVKQPGGYIYDVYGDMKPEDFLNMHMPIAYQDDKVISAVDEWLKRMPVDAISADAFEYKGGEQKYRDTLRGMFIDNKHKVPYKDLVPILGDQYAKEHATILRDLGLPGQKWFSSYEDGRQRRRDSYTLFERLKGLQSKNNSADYSRVTFTEEIKKLEDFINNTPLTNDNMPSLFEANAKKAQFEQALSNLSESVKTNDVEADLYNLYNRNAVYNYVVNDPSRLTITGRQFKPKGRRY